MGGLRRQYAPAHAGGFGDPSQGVEVRRDGQGFADVRALTSREIGPPQKRAVPPHCLVNIAGGAGDVVTRLRLATQHGTSMHHPVAVNCLQQPIAEHLAYFEAPPPYPPVFLDEAAA